MFGQSVPFYVLSFDKSGRCTSPKTRAEVVTRLRDEEFSDVIIYAHGWNTDWAHAIERYSGFFTGVGDMARQHGDLVPSGIKPMFVGISWPSAALVWPSEETPDLLASGGDVDDVAWLAEDMSPHNAARLKELADKTTPFTRSDLAELAALLEPIVGKGAEDSLDEDGGLLDMFQAADLTHAETGSDDDIGFLDDDGPGDGPQAAGLADLFGVRQVLRLATVYQMKDRAGLPRALLGAARPLRAFVGHVQPTFDWSIRQPKTKQGLASAFAGCFYQRLFTGAPIELAMDAVRSRGAGLWNSMYLSARRLSQTFDEKYRGQLLAAKLMARDWQSLVLLGDPTVRVI